MRRFVLVLGMLVVPLMWLGAEPAAACSCVIRSVPELVDDADVVVTAQLVREESDRQRAVLTFIGTERYKGDVTPGFQVETSAQSSMCGLGGMVEGRRYVVLLQEDGGTFSASSCGGTGRATPAYVEKVEAVTGPGMSFDLPPPGPDPSSVAAAAEQWSASLSGAFWR